MMISMKGLGIVLFVVVQISVVLCASTEKPSDKHLGGFSRFFSVGKVISAGDTSKIFEKQNVVQHGSAAQLDATIPSKMWYDDYIDYHYRESYEVAVNVYVITAITLAVFTVLSFILGCIMCLCCRKEPRRGYVVNTSGGQTSVMQQPPVAPPGIVQRMQHYPPEYGQKQ